MVGGQGVMGQTASEEKLVDGGLVDRGLVVGVPFTLIRAWLLDYFQSYRSKADLASNDYAKRHAP